MRKHIAWYETRANPVNADWRGHGKLGQLSDRDRPPVLTTSKMLQCDAKRQDLSFAREMEKLYGWDFE